jgi:hypothetical protein
MDNNKQNLLIKKGDDEGDDFAPSFILLLFIVYLVLILPKLPTFVAILFENTIFRIIVIYYIIQTGNKNPKLSLMIAFTFLIIIHTLNKQYIKDLSNSNTL